MRRETLVAVIAVSPPRLHKGLSELTAAKLAALPPCRECRSVRGFSVGSDRRGPGVVGILWGCPRPAARPSAPRPASCASPCTAHGLPARRGKHLAGRHDLYPGLVVSATMRRVLAPSGSPTGACRWQGRARCGGQGAAGHQRAGGEQCRLAHALGIFPPCRPERKSQKPHYPRNDHQKHNWQHGGQTHDGPPQQYHPDPVPADCGADSTARRGPSSASAAARR